MAQTILVVDDSQTVVKFVTLALRGKGFVVLTATDGMDAVEKCSQHPDNIDLIITDLNMPNLDGYGLIRTVRSNPALLHLPIIILSSEEEEKDREKGFSSGANAYLVKPFKADALLREVERLLMTPAGSSEGRGVRV